jgi:hypothetical protein
MKNTFDKNIAGLSGIVPTVDVPVEHRESTEKRDTDQVLKPLDIRVVIDNGVNLLNTSDGGEKLQHFSLLFLLKN